MSEKTKTYEAGRNDGRAEIMTKVLKNRARMASDYRNTIKHTGGLLTQSMSFAYAKGLDAAFKLITTKETNETQESVETK